MCYRSRVLLHFITTFSNNCIRYTDVFPNNPLYRCYEHWDQIKPLHTLQNIDCVLWTSSILADRSCAQLHTRLKPRSAVITFWASRFSNPVFPAHFVTLVWTDSFSYASNYCGISLTPSSHLHKGRVFVISKHFIKSIHHSKPWSIVWELNQILWPKYGYT